MMRDRLLGLILIMATSAVAQDPNFIIERISLEQGLSQSVVDVIFQDSKGYLWFGTQDGLNRYDGYSFVVYKNEPGNSNTLPGNTITAMAEDHEGKLWVGTLDGLSCIDGTSITNYVANVRDPSALMSNYITALQEDSSGALWVGTDAGLQIFDRTAKLFQRISDPVVRAGALQSTVNVIRRDRQNRIWLGTTRCLLKFEKGRFSSYYPDGRHGSISDSTVFSILEDRGGRLWFGTRRGGLNRYEEETDSFVALKYDPNDLRSIPSNNTISISQDTKGRIWIGTFGDGLILYDNDRFYHFLHDPKDPTTISDNEIGKVFSDKSGTVWAGTSGGGVNKIKENKFTVLRSDPHKLTGLSSDDIWGIHEDRDGRLWIGSYDEGLNVLQEGKIFRLHHDAGDSRSLIFDYVYSIFEDRDGQIWIATDRGISKRVPGDKLGVFQNIVHRPDDPTSLSSNSVLQIFQDSKGNIWVSTLGGGVNFLSADQIKKPNPSFVRIQADTSKINTLSDNQVFSIAEDSKGHLWFGTQNGLNEYDGEKFTVYKKQINNSNCLSHNSIISLYMTADDFLWIGTQGGGLNLLKNGKFTVFTQKDGLPNNVVYSILEDSEGNLWMSTNSGISRFNPGKPGREAFKNFDIMDGLPSNEFNQGAAYKSKNGTFYFGGIAGVVAFNPKNLAESSYSPPVYLTAFRKFDQEIDFGQEFSVVKRVDISYKENFFGFDFVALDYRSPQKNQYAYRLDGFDDDWIYTNSRRYASYTNIDGGNYVFKVKATNSDGVWSEHTAEVRLVVHPPFWKTLWFRFSTAFFVIGAAYSFYRSRMRQIKLRNVLLEKKVHERTKEIEEKNKILDSQNKELENKNAQIRHQQAQIIQSEKLSSLGRLVSGVAHEINNPLNYTYGSSANLEVDFEDMLSVIEAKMQEGKISAEFGRDLVGRIKEMQDMVQAIKRGSTRIKDVVVGLRDFSTSDDVAQAEIDLNINLDYVLSLLRSRDRKQVTILKEFNDVPKIKGFPGHFNQAVMNVLINAMEAIDRRHYTGNEGVVKLRTIQEGAFVVISITDNGDGIEESIRDKVFEPFFTTKEIGKGTGLGLATTYGVVENHGGKVSFESEVGRGTEFKLFFPIAD